MEDVKLFCDSLHESPKISKKSTFTGKSSSGFHLYSKNKAFNLLNEKEITSHWEGLSVKNKEKWIEMAKDEELKKYNNKFELIHIRKIQKAFDKLPLKVQLIAINEALKSLLIPGKKSTEQKGIAYSLFQVIMLDTKNNSKKIAWMKIAPKINKLRKVFNEQKSAYLKLISSTRYRPEIIKPIPKRRLPSRKTKKRSSTIVRKSIKRLKRATIRKSPTKNSRRKKYDKEYQTREELEDNDPLILYYTSLYKEKPNSETSILWLTKFGLFDGIERKTLIKKFEKIKKK